MPDKAFFEEQTGRAAGTLYRVAAGLLRVEQDREDAIQQALEKAWQKRHTLRCEQYFTTWLVRILINECHGILRQKARTVPMACLPEEETPAYDPTVRDLVDRLPEKQRLCVIMHYIEGMSVADTARALRVTGTTVRGRLMQARKRLRLEWNEEDI